MSLAGGDELESALTAGVRGLGLTAKGGQIAALLGFLHLMQKWGKTYNLTAIRDLRAAVDLHLLDSLAVSPFLEGRSILDVGTGAGLPGLPLAILHPERRFVLLDASAWSHVWLGPTKASDTAANVSAVGNQMADSTQSR